METAILRGLQVQPGMRVLHVGCGIGTDAFELATLVGPSGMVTGVDFSESLIAEAVRRGAGPNLCVTFEVGDAPALRFPTSCFEAVRTERMLMHVPDPSKALAEMSRVLRVGGPMAVHDFDWESQFCDSPYKDTTRKIALSFCDGMKNGWIGRRLPRLFRDVGLTDVSVSYHTITVTYDFLQLCWVNMLPGRWLAAFSRSRKPISGGAISRKQRLKERSFTASQHSLSRAQGLSRESAHSAPAKFVSGPIFAPERNRNVLFSGRSCHSELGQARSP